MKEEAHEDNESEADCMLLLFRLNAGTVSDGARFARTNAITQQFNYTIQLCAFLASVSMNGY
jgi:hypothetical protein